MTFHSSDYENFLAQYSSRTEAISLLRQHRPYFELIPSLRRPEDSLITIPLPIVRLRHSHPSVSDAFKTISTRETLALPSDLAIIMCDPEWKIRLGAEIFLFIQRLDEDFSHLLSRWRRVQVLLDQEYEWVMPLKESYMFSEGADKIYPLFIIFEEKPLRIRKGLSGACLPFIIHSFQTSSVLENPEVTLNEF